MTEKEKMLQGLPYYADKDETLKNERLECKKLCHKHNQLSPEKLEERKTLLKRLSWIIHQKKHIIILLIAIRC